jgi:hypothetical protein
MSQSVLAQSVDSRVLQLRKLENDRAWIEKMEWSITHHNIGRCGSHGEHWQMTLLFNLLPFVIAAIGLGLSWRLKKVWILWQQ